jgi:hypothetical protein
MTGYRRTTTDGRYSVTWQPDDEQTAVDALASVDGTGVADESDLPSDGLVDLDGQPDVQQAVRDEFERLTTDTTDGGTSG